MELKGLLPFVLMLTAIGILIGISMVVMSEIGTTSRLEVTVVNDSIYLLNNTVNSLDHANLTEWTGIINASSTTFPVENYTLAMTNGTVEVSYAGKGNSTCGQGKVCYATYKYYEYNTPTATVMSSTTSELGGIATNWLGIVTICVIAAIVLGLVMSNFQKRR